MFSSRMDTIEMSGIRKMFELASGDSVNLGLGEPDFQPPEAAVEAVSDAMKRGLNKYGPSSGILPLREAISKRVHRHMKDAGPENVVVTSSGSEALFSSFLTFVNYNERVLIPEPGFVLYQPHSRLVGGVDVPYRLTIEDDFRPDPDEIARLADGNTKMLVVNSPNNPTGGVITRQDRDDLVDVAREKGMVILSDEVYDTIIYPGATHHSFLGVYERAVVVNSFSKIYAMTGWRIGYMAAEIELISKLSLAHFHLVACPSTPIQYGALKALQEGDSYVSTMVEKYRARRDLITSRLNEIPGFHALSPKGSFYSFPSFEMYRGGKRLSSQDLAMEAAKNDLICSPGTAFGKAGENHLRFSFATSRKNISRGMDILEDVVRGFQHHCP